MINNRYFWFTQPWFHYVYPLRMRYNVNATQDPKEYLVNVQCCFTEDLSFFPQHAKPTKSTKPILANGDISFQNAVPLADVPEDDTYLPYWYAQRLKREIITERDFSILSQETADVCVLDGPSYTDLLNLYESFLILKKHECTSHDSLNLHPNVINFKEAAEFARRIRRHFPRIILVNMKKYRANKSDTFFKLRSLLIPREYTGISDRERLFHLQQWTTLLEKYHLPNLLL